MKKVFRVNVGMNRRNAQLMAHLGGADFLRRCFERERVTNIEAAAFTAVWDWLEPQEFKDVMANIAGTPQSLKFQFQGKPYKVGFTIPAEIVPVNPRYSEEQNFMYNVASMYLEIKEA
jgi:hypothetical protein